MIKIGMLIADRYEILKKSGPAVWQMYINPKITL